MAGRLTLSWVNKDQALVPNEQSGYSWVDRDDPRVTEVRLLQPAGIFGDASGTPDDNLLIQGDSYDALHALTRIPEYAQRYRGKVKLIYIDPPFNTGQAFEHYDDALEHSVWLGMMRERLLLLRELLAEDGSIWVHLDDAEMAYCRVLMDEVFGRGAFIATVLWQKSYTRENRTAISVGHEYILVYSPMGLNWKAVRNPLPSSEEQLGRYVNFDNDARGPWKPTPMHAKAEKGRRQSQFYTVVTPSGREVNPPPGTCWRFTRERYEEHLADDRIYFGKNGDGVPTLKKFLNEVQSGLVPNSWWTHDEVGTTGTAKAEIVALFPSGTPFSTPKPERLMQRIIHVATNPGDLVLDCFAGSGTTAAVAHKMGRRWIASELSSDTVNVFTQPRLQKVTSGEDNGGISGDVGWTGGGGFRTLQVGPPLYERAGRHLLLAEWAKGDDFAQAVAAQLGFTFEIDAPFHGRKGRTRLAVLDGVADDVVLRAIAAQLGEDERVTVVAKATAPGAAEVLKDLSRGSRLLKAPQDLVRQGKVVR
ncbi:site-specific DNA-methyltransferase [Nocardia veterana]|uniref:Site-specific DNA-methyltransferase n=1 Tax=Nocardia veterana TaxID=132249 RepID=A0A7X6M2Q4_9NOCA|nr:site-specific DNA-methyltransferase [Nocardia veterana]NKY88167.1 site-specific DNA-methyltransferase [Nocardia veterana]